MKNKEGLVCPKCKSLLFEAGNIQMKKASDKYKTVIVYYCKLCNWRGIMNEKRS